MAMAMAMTSTIGCVDFFPGDTENAARVPTEGSGVAGRYGATRPGCGRWRRRCRESGPGASPAARAPKSRGPAPAAAPAPAPRPPPNAGARPAQMRRKNNSETSVKIITATRISRSRLTWWTTVVTSCSNSVTPTRYGDGWKAAGFSQRTSRRRRFK